jgi:DNA-binding XRE family transcriptional regulator
MANFAAALKAEVVRLARKEVRAHTRALQRASAAHRRQIAALRRQLAALEKRAGELARRAPRALPATAGAEADAGQVRFVAKGLKSLRARLGLSAGELGRLIGVSGQSVYNWENRKAVPRRAQVQALAQLRGLGKKDVRARLDGGTGEAAAEAKPRAAAKAAGKRATGRKAAGKAKAPASKRGGAVRKRATQRPARARKTAAAPRRKRAG